MKSFKEIVTKAVIGKGKKNYINSYELTLDNKPDTILGCWVINHNITGKNNNGSVLINGSFDVNIWYSYDNNTKTDVVVKKIEYNELVNVRLKEETMLTDQSEIIIRSLKNPSCIDASVEENKVKYTIEKELGIEIIGDTKVMVQIEDEFDDYDIIEDELSKEEQIEILNNIDKEINENYLNDNDSIG